MRIDKDILDKLIHKKFIQNVNIKENTSPEPSLNSWYDFEKNIKNIDDITFQRDYFSSKILQKLFQKTIVDWCAETGFDYEFIKESIVHQLNDFFQKNQSPTPQQILSFFKKINSDDFVICPNCEYENNKYWEICENCQSPNELN